jgi:hypothetical protein
MSRYAVGSREQPNEIGNLEEKRSMRAQLGETGEEKDRAGRGYRGIPGGAQMLSYADASGIQEVISGKK